MEATKIDLLPCPFCSGIAEYHVSGAKRFVYCTKCGARTEGVYVHEDPDWKVNEARMWNACCRDWRKPANGGMERTAGGKAI